MEGDMVVVGEEAEAEAGFNDGEIGVAVGAYWSGSCVGETEVE